MGFYHITEQGDDLPKIADEYGFQDYKTIWNAPENDDLRGKRQPTVLMPGDSIYVPDKKIGEVDVDAGAKHRFRLKVAIPKLRLLLTGFDGKPLASTACTLTLGSSRRDVATDSRGMLECPLPAGTDEGTLVVGAREIDLKVGHLDPTDQRSGLIERLRNLGYLDAIVGDEADSEVDDSDVAFAVSCFQRDFGLPVDGDAQAIVEKLKDAYGC